MKNNYRLCEVLLFCLLMGLFIQPSFSMWSDLDDDNEISSEPGSIYTEPADLFDDMEIENFQEFLSKRALKRYRKHEKRDRRWRESKRNEYLEDVVAGVRSTFDGASEIKAMCECATRPEHTSDLLNKIHQLAYQCYPDSLYDDEYYSTLGSYRHKLIHAVSQTIQDCCMHEKIGGKGITNLEFETAYFNKKRVSHRHRGSVRPDAFWPQQGWAFDHKFGEAKVTSQDVRMWRKHLSRYCGYTVIRGDE